MALPGATQVRIWGIVIALFVLIMWLLGDVILPFVLAGAIAYCLDPVADWLEEMGLSRVMATIAISSVAILLFVIAFFAIRPALVREASALIEMAPTIFNNLQGFIDAKLPSLEDETSAIGQSLKSVGEMLRAKGGALIQSILTSALSLINILMLVVIVPVVTFYLLLDWDRIVENVDELLPRDHAPTIRGIANDVDRTLASFVRGQVTVMIILGFFYAIALSLAGLQFGVVVGAVAGLLTFIPYVGALVGGALALGLALFQFWGDFFSIALIAGIFFFGQFMEGNILTPKLVGKSVGLHPVWLLLALSVFGTLFGFVGMLVAVPLAAAIGVVARFFVTQYKTGRLYQGLEGLQAVGGDTRQKADEG
ncbi:MAG: AI-2E family transporter [Pseudomonadota bacterium]